MITRFKNRYKISVVVSLCAIVAYGGLNTAFARDSAASQDRKRNRLESLFIWKVSDELKLDQATEQKLSTIVKDLGSKKSKMSEDLAVIVEELRNANTKKRGSLLLKYEENIRNYSRLNQNEFTQLRSLLGDARLSRYLVLKSDFAQKMRDLVSAKEIEGDTREASEKAKSNLRKKEN